MDFAQSRCFHHAQREAVARCPGCSRFFCRECVSEFKGRLLCAQCVAARTNHADHARRAWLAPIRPITRFLIGLLLVWTCFFILGKALLAVPSTFNDAVTQEFQEP